MSTPATVRPARASETARLSDIAHAAKAHWDYPPEWLELWRPSLTFDAATLERQWVRVAEIDGDAVAVVAVDGEPPTLELSHLWVHPAAMGRGLGRRLFELAVEHARSVGASRLEIVSDPHAEAFYRRLGAHRRGEVESRPAGRQLPLLERAL